MKISNLATAFLATSFFPAVCLGNDLPHPSADHNRDELVAVDASTRVTAKFEGSAITWKHPMVVRRLNADDYKQEVEDLLAKGGASLGGTLDLSTLSSSGETSFRVNPGVVTPASVKVGTSDISIPETLFPKQGYTHPVDGVSRVRDIQPGNLANDDTVIGADRAIWFADTIVLPKDSIVIIPSKIKYFSIVANKIEFGENSIVTWSPKESTENPPTYVPPAPKAPPERPTCIHNRSPVCNGHPGYEGVKGMKGNDGEDAPIVEVWAEEIVGVPRFHLVGQDGQSGGAGGPGSRGGKGAHGRKAKAARFCFGCKWNKGWGGDGGLGGKGGEAGDGGDGGRGGKLSIFTSSEETKLSLNRFFFLADGGDPGPSGIPGDGGQGGEGGPQGGGSRCCLRPKESRDGKSGLAGTPGNLGSSGNQSTEVFNPNLELQTITEPEWNIKLASPRVNTVESEVVAKGDTVKLSGANFAGGAMVVRYSSGRRVEANVLSSSSLTFVHPGGVAGPEEILVLEKTDAGGVTVESNPFSIRTQMTLDYIEQGNCKTDLQDRISPNDCVFKVGTTVKVHGDGFDNSTRVFFGDLSIPQELVKVVAPDLIEFELQPWPAVTESTIYGDKVTMRLRTGSAVTDFTENVTFIMEFFEVLVLGDSVEWGQGHYEKDKFSHIISQYMVPRTLLRVLRTVLAHSGALIGPNDRRLQISLTDEEILTGEIPRPDPSIREQAFSLYNGNAENVRLIIVDGCINDAGVFQTAINPLATDRKVSQTAQEMCYGRLKPFLDELADAFPCARIIVTNYYQILSKRPKIETVLTISTFLKTLSPILGPLAISAYALMADTSSEWYSKSTHYIKASVAEVNERTGRVYLAESGIGSRNAMFSSDSYLFDSFDDDPVSSIRRRGCNGKEDFICWFASWGHPNVKGARLIADKMEEIVNTFDTLVLEVCGSQQNVISKSPPRFSELSVTSMELLDQDNPNKTAPAFEHSTIRLHGNGFWKDDEVFFLQNTPTTISRSCSNAYLRTEQIEKSSIDLVDVGVNDDGSAFADVTIKFNAADTFVLCYVQYREETPLTRRFHLLAGMTMDVDLPRSLELETTVVTRTPNPQRVNVVLPSGIQMLDYLWLTTEGDECKVEDAEGKMIEEIPDDRTVSMELPSLEDGATAVRVCALFAMQTAYATATIFNHVAALECPEEVSTNQCIRYCIDDGAKRVNFKRVEPVTSCANVCICEYEKRNLRKSST